MRGEKVACCHADTVVKFEVIADDVVALEATCCQEQTGKRYRGHAEFRGRCFAWGGGWGSVGGPGRGGGCGSLLTWIAPESCPLRISRELPFSSGSDRVALG